MLRNLLNIIAAPREAFASIRERPSILFPLLLLLLATVSIQFGFFALVDPQYMVDQLVEQALEMTSVPEDQLRAAYAGMSPMSLAVTSAVSSAVILILILLIFSGYLTLVSKISNDGIGFRRWFSLVCWCLLPMLFSVLATWIIMLSAPSGMIELERLQPLTLNALLFHSSGPFQTLLGTIDVTHLWSLGLLVYAYQYWTVRNLAKSLLIVLLPYILLYGVWSLIILF